MRGLPRTGLDAALLKVLRLALALSTAALAARPVPSAADALPPGTPPLDFALLAHFGEVYRSVRLGDSPDVVRRAWESSYEQVVVVDLERTRNRYLLGTLDGGATRHVVIRGTANARNKLYDIQVRKHWNRELGTLLHVGFERMALALASDLEPRLVPGARLVLFGHSLGAAEAVIVGMLLRQRGWEVSAINAVGQPKLTDRRGVEKWRGLPVLRLSCEEDPFPLLPPRFRVSLAPLEHLGPEVVLLGEGRYAVAGDGGPRPACFGDAWRALGAPGPRASVDVHEFCPNYYETFLALARGATEVTGYVRPAAAPASGVAAKPRERRHDRD